MIMLPKAKDDLTIDQKLDSLAEGQIHITLKLEELEEDLIEIRDTFKNIEIFIGATSEYLLKHVKTLKRRMRNNEKQRE